MIVVLKRYGWGLHLVTIALCSYLVAQSLSNYLASRLEVGVAPLSVQLPPQEKPEKQEKGEDEELAEISDEEAAVEKYSIIEQRNLFNSQSVGGTGGQGEIPTDQLVQEGQAVKTSLPIKLIGTLVVGAGTDRRSSATVSGDKARDGKVYYVGDEESFSPNVKLVKVDKNRIELVNSGRLEYAEVEEGEKRSIFAKASEVHGEKKEGSAKSEPSTTPGDAAVAPEGGLIVVDQSAIDDALANLDRFYTEVRIVPHFEAGRVSGMKVLSVKPGSIIAKLGIKRGDILERINGQELDVKRGMALFTELKDQRSFTIDLKRGGKNQTLEYQIR